MTEHFRLSEFTRSATAQARGIDNTPMAEQIDNLRNLCEQVLEPLRAFAGCPIVINSGYRCPALNAAVGGVPGSQHQSGQAADIRITNSAKGRKWMEWIILNCLFDQCIWETADGRNFWLHVSCRRNIDQNRHHVISYLTRAG